LFSKSKIPNQCYDISSPAKVKEFTLMLTLLGARLIGTTNQVVLLWQEPELWDHTLQY
jgi:hypothetical protein